MGFYEGCKSQAFNMSQTNWPVKEKSRNRTAEGRPGNVSEPQKWSTGGFNNPQEFGCNLIATKLKRLQSHPQGAGNGTSQLLSRDRFAPVLKYKSQHYP